MKAHKAIQNARKYTRQYNMQENTLCNTKQMEESNQGNTICKKLHQAIQDGFKNAHKSQGNTKQMEQHTRQYKMQETTLGNTLKIVVSRWMKAHKAIQNARKYTLATR